MLLKRVEREEQMEYIGCSGLTQASLSSFQQGSHTLGMGQMKGMKKIQKKKGGEEKIKQN